jgi:hypothetical protein
MGKKLLDIHGINYVVFGGDMFQSSRGTFSDVHAYCAHGGWLRRNHKKGDLDWMVGM